VDVPLHESDDQLELYALDRLSELEAARVEDHVILCDVCRDRLEEVGTFAFAMRDALLTQPAMADRERFGWLRSWFAGPRLAMAGAFAAVLLAVGIYWMGGSSRMASVASLQLTAIRGSEVQAVAAARELDLTVTDAPAEGAPFRLEVVDSGGAGVWTGTGLEAKVKTRLAPGDYFVRLYSAQGQLLHEYEFRVRA